MSSVNSVETMIIGAGPAGLAAGFKLANEQRPFTLLEASILPREKACADIITSKAIREIHRCEPSIIEQWSAAGRINPIWKTILHIEDEEHEIQFRSLDDSADVPSCYSIKRSDMDYALYQQLSKSPYARCIEGSRVSNASAQPDGRILVESTTGNWLAEECIWTAGADMRKKPLARPTKERHSALGVRSYCTGLKGIAMDACHLFLRKDWMPGGLYIAPLADGSYNVNVVVRKDRVKKERLQLPQLLKETVSADPRLKNIFEDAKVIGKAVGAPLPLASGPMRLYEEGLWRAGDAAGLVDLISANGIPQAMISGRMAAEAVIRKQEGMRVTDSAELYTADLRSAIAPDVVLGKGLSIPLSSPWICNRILDIMSHIGKRAGKKDGGLDSILYSDRPIKEFLSLLNPLSSIKS